MTKDHLKRQTVFKDENQITNKKTRTGMNEKFIAALCYFLFFITGILFLMIEKDNSFIRFHALQAIILGVCILPVMSTFFFISSIGWLIPVSLVIISFLIWSYFIYQTLKGRKVPLPFIGEAIERQIR